jgi:hypothetical protein
MRICVLSLLFLATLLMTLCSTVPAHATSTWSIQTIDKTSTGDGAIAIDSNNNPHIQYNHYENSSPRSPLHRMYGSWNGSAWNTQPLPTEIVRFFNFVLDSNNNPHILYTAGVDHRLMYAWWTGSNWTTQTVTKERAIGGFLALDSAGNPHVAYTVNLPLSDYPSGVTNNIAMLKYTSWNGSSWITQTIDSPISHFSGVYLALNSNNNPHIMYGNETLYFPPDGGYKSLWTVKFAAWNGSTWNIQTAFSNLSAYGNMVLDSKGYPHFVCSQDYPSFKSGNSTLSYASWNGSVWNTQIVVSNAKLGDTAFVALDSYDYPHIDFFNSTSDSLVYAGWTGSVWDFQIVGPNSLAIYAGPIAMDSNGNAHIIYTGNPDLSRSFGEEVYTMYATAPQPIYTPTPSPTQVPSSTFSSFPSLIIVSVFIIIIAATLVYVWKKKTQKL